MGMNGGRREAKPIKGSHPDGVESDCGKFIFCEPVTRGSWPNYLALVMLLKSVVQAPPLFGDAWGS